MFIVWRIGDNSAYLVTAHSMRQLTWEEYQAYKVAWPDIPEHSAIRRPSRPSWAPSTHRPKP